MRTDKEKATIMRKAGMTYADIKEQLGVPKATLSLWFKNEKWSNEITTKAVRDFAHRGSMRLMVLNTVRGNRLKSLYEEARQDALNDFHELKFHPLFISGIMNYWAHGDKTSKNKVSIASADLRIIKLAKLFLENVCQAKNLDIRLLLDPKMSETMAKDYWVSKCGFKYEQFGKSALVRHKKYHGKIHYGVCIIGLNSAYLKRKILKWLDLLSSELINGEYLKVL